MLKSFIFQDEEVVEEADYEEEQPQEASSTTEAPKKFIKSGIVRPFRSNDDLLATLKRRREQVVSSKYILLKKQVLIFQFSLLHEKVGRDNRFGSFGTDDFYF